MWFMGEERFVDSGSLLLSWTVGSVLLNTWAALCCFSVFTVEFWVDIGNGMLDAPPQNQEPAAEQQANQEVQDQVGEENVAQRWQGKDGRAARFFNICKSLLFKWEWEVVDHVVMIEECALPVSGKLATLLISPSILTGVWVVIANFLGISGSFQYRILVFRVFTVVTLAVQMSIAFRAQIRAWFGAVHNAARDDRFLIGEILLNYSPETHT